jgi:hypothetical protein
MPSGEYRSHRVNQVDRNFGLVHESERVHVRSKPGNLFAEGGNKNEWYYQLVSQQLLSSRQPILSCHENVAHDDIRQQTLGGLDEFVTISDNSYNLKCLAEDLENRAPHFPVVIRNQHARRFHDRIHSCGRIARETVPEKGIVVVAPEQ